MGQKEILEETEKRKCRKGFSEIFSVYVSSCQGSFYPLLELHVFFIDHIDAKHNRTVGTFWAPREYFYYFMTFVALINKTNKKSQVLYFTIPVINV